MKTHTWILTIILTFIMGACTSSKNSTMYLAVGTYTHKTSEGIYIYNFDIESADHSLVSSFAMDNPSFLTFSKDGSQLFAVSENDDEVVDKLASLHFDKTNGTISLVDSKKTLGAAPCNVLYDEANAKVYTANYSGGTISAFDIDQSGNITGGPKVVSFVEQPGPNKDRQKQSHLHCVYLSPDKRFLFANDLGTDCIYQFDLSNDSPLDSYQVIPLKAGSGPRHTIFHPTKKWAYTVTELSGEVIVLDYQDNTLKPIQTVLADSNEAAGSADIQMTPDGKFLFASNRLVGDGVAIFRIGDDGKLESIGYQPTGVHPRNMVVTPNGKFLLVACRDDNVIEVYEIDRKKGLLTNVKKNIEVSMPVCLKLTSIK